MQDINITYKFKMFI